MKKIKPVVEGEVRGKGGELHQTSNQEVPILTTQQGTPVSDDQNSLKVGARGATTLEDFHLREKIFHFDHERIPERVVHARGYGAHGYFWDFISLMPESMQMIMWVMSDRAIPRSFRFMEGFGIHTFRLVTAQGNATFVKLSSAPELGLQLVVWNQP